MEGLLFWRVIKTFGEPLTCNYFTNERTVLFSHTSTNKIHSIIALLSDEGEEIKLDAFVSYTNIELLCVILKWLKK